MGRETDIFIVGICFPAFLFSLITAYLYLKDRNKFR